jgi:hypothetical protein
MDPTIQQALQAWRASLTDKERRLHQLAAVELKKKIAVDDDDNGSYYPEFCHAFKAWQKAQVQAQAQADQRVQSISSSSK